MIGAFIADGISIFEKMLKSRKKTPRVNNIKEMLAGYLIIVRKGINPSN